ncbi:eIF-2-alpha kinase GCN2, partial [Cucurbita argyrosperma subsp. argyrosperma]
MGHSSKKKRRGGGGGGKRSKGRTPQKDHSFSGEESELISEELTALCGIFQEDCKVVSGPSPQVTIKLRPYSNDMGFEDLDVSAFLSVNLVAKYLPGYPYKCPKLLITPEKGLAKGDTEKLLSLLHEQKFRRDLLWEGVDERKGSHLVRWDSMTKPLDFGGLGIAWKWIFSRIAGSYVAAFDTLFQNSDKEGLCLSEAVEKKQDTKLDDIPICCSQAFASYNARDGRIMIFNLAEAAQEFLSEIVTIGQSNESSEEEAKVVPYGEGSTNKLKKNYKRCPS